MTDKNRLQPSAFLGYYEKGKLLYAGRTRNGFTPAIRVELAKRLRPVLVAECPFDNLPETKGGRWGQGLTAAKMSRGAVLELLEDLKFRYMRGHGSP